MSDTSADANKINPPIFIVVEQGIVSMVYLDQDIEVIVVDKDVQDDPKLADVTSAHIGTIADLKRDIVNCCG